MLFDPENHVNKLCISGMQLEGEGKPDEAAELFQQAWNIAGNDVERLSAAHYIARHQKTVADKLKWDEVALNLALKINTDEIKVTFPSLYLNIAKCHEDLRNINEAHKHYLLALKFADLLPDDGYGKMIKTGINNGVARVKAISD
jgi:rifampin ADP-ribosylating transferase